MTPQQHHKWSACRACESLSLAEVVVVVVVVVAAAGGMIAAFLCCCDEATVILKTAELEAEQLIFVTAQLLLVWSRPCQPQSLEQRWWNRSHGCSPPCLNFPCKIFFFKKDLF